ncbi:MAG: SDR family NAD(P)-dependent oxidoreductase [Melioribacteraceae bacterium]|nr:SDR family NAD(P)-dependent oxidoreductase [Melioribacteraceae bacterium]
MNLENKIVLVTGGGSGIGLETANYISQKGAKVIICGRNEAKLAEAAEAFNLHSIKCDVSIESEVLSLFEKIKKDFGTLDVLINNAGFGDYSNLLDQSLESMLSVFETNVFGAMLVGREAAKIFCEKKAGSIVNISSTAGLKGFAGGTAYAASKFALRGMTECWRAELRPFNVRVILINPSEVQTPFFKSRKAEINPTKLLPGHIAHSIVAALEMDDVGFIPELTVFATNPKQV